VQIRTTDLARCRQNSFFLRRSFVNGCLGRGGWSLEQLHGRHRDRKEHGEDAHRRHRFGDGPRLPNHTGRIGNWRVAAANRECKNWCQSHHRVHQERLGEMRPRELRDRLAPRPKSHEEREQLEEQIDGEKPAQVVRERHPEVASALLPDPLMLDGRVSGTPK